MTRNSLITDPDALVQLSVKVPNRIRKQFQIMILAQDSTIQDRLARLIERDIAENQAAIQAATTPDGASSPA